MPCDDVTEIIRLTFDASDRLASYSLIKRSCGRAVGERSLIQEWAQGRTAEDILAEEPETFLNAHPCSDDAEEFLHLKHYVALRSALSVLLGREPGGAGEACAAASVVYGPEGLEFEGELLVSVMTEAIKACGNCAGCGTKKRPKSQLPVGPAGTSSAG